jgi:curved DNA-binding protein CbpA
MAKAFRQLSVHLAYLHIISLQNAFRRKAMEYHPDQNQNNKGKYSFTVSHPLCKANMPIGYVRAQKLPFLSMAEVAEAKFKEVMDSYEAIKLERRNRSC